MPGRKKKAFINKKNGGLTFKLTSSGLEFTDAESCKKAQEKFKIGLNEDEEIVNSEFLDPESRRKVQEKYNIFAEEEDDYNYLQHLRERRNETKEDERKNANLPHSDTDRVLITVSANKVFTLVLPPEAQKVEDDVDSELKEALAALDSDQEAFEEDETFFDQLLKSSSTGEKARSVKSSEKESFLNDARDDDEEEVEEELFPDDCFDEENVDTDNSGEELDSGEDGEDEEDDDSPVSRRGKQLDALVSDVTRQCKNLELEEELQRHLEKAACEMSDDNSEDFEDFEEALTKDMEKAQRIMEEEAEKSRPILMKDVYEKPIDREKILTRFEYESNPSDEEIVEVVKEVDPLRGFDCESFVLSRASNRTFTPKIIEIMPQKPKRKKKPTVNTEEVDSMSGVSLNSERQIKMTKHSCPDHGSEDGTQKVAAVLRDKNETVEEKRARKQAVKEQQRERREEKSERKKLFSQEMKKRKEEKMKSGQSLASARIE